MEGGLLQGPAAIRLRNGVYVRAKMRDGAMHGFAHSVGARIAMPLAKEHKIQDVNDPTVGGGVEARDGIRFKMVQICVLLRDCTVRRTGPNFGTGH